MVALGRVLVAKHHQGLPSPGPAWDSEEAEKGWAGGKEGPVPVGQIEVGVTVMELW